MGKKKTQGQGAEHLLADMNQVQDDGMSYELEINAETVESIRIAGRRRSFDEGEHRLRRFGAAAMLQTRGNKSKHYGNNVTVDEDTGQYSERMCCSCSKHSCDWGYARDVWAMKNIEILLQEMTTRAKTSI
ncbi:hypothetical protein ACJMK2_038036 [Sinanodonta woodiana]|uniref:SWIM-type domain-containing protein n=1 Tax=Sinanodonta woodiana TaxID=1069815 RepID=A0ABD3WMA1_SINWO